jgi:NAD(P)-dependent dehydrogenase (short-subunit alcohol dehydrogenase family)
LHISGNRSVSCRNVCKTGRVYGCCAPKVAESQLGSVAGKTVIVTGSNTGIGFETAKSLYNHGATVVMACRSLTKAADAASAIAGGSGEALSTPRGRLVQMQLDLSSLASVKEFAAKVVKEVGTLDCMVHNAGVAFVPGGAVTTEGASMVLGTNHVGVFHLDQLLFAKYVADGTRVVVTSSLAANSGTLRFEPTLTWSGDEYGASKLANLLHAFELNRRLQAARAVKPSSASSSSSSGRPVPLSVSLHPGIVRTAIFRHMGGCAGSIVGCLSSIAFLSVEEGAQTTLHLATAPHAELATQAGCFFSHCRPTYVSHGQARDRDSTGPQLWEASERMVESLTAPSE